MSVSERTAKKPLLLATAIIAAALILPSLALLDHFGSYRGDGLSYFWPALLIYAGCAMTSLICMVAGLVRGERPRWLAPIAIALWLLPVFVLVF